MGPASSVPTTTRNFEPKNRDLARKKTGANAVDYQVDLDVSGIPRGATTVTKGGLPEYPIQGDTKKYRNEQAHPPTIFQAARRRGRP